MFGLREGPLLNDFLLIAFLLQTLMIFHLIFHAVFFVSLIFFKLFFRMVIRKSSSNNIGLFYQNSCAIYCRHQARTQEVANEPTDELIQQQLVVKRVYSGTTSFHRTIKWDSTTINQQQVASLKQPIQAALRETFQVQTSQVSESTRGTCLD